MSTRTVPHRAILARASVLLCCTVVACGGGVDSVDPKYESPGPHAVGNTTITTEDSARGRTLHVEVWYPAETAGAVTGESVESFIVDPVDRAIYQQLLADAPVGCPSTRTGSTRDAAALDNGPYPLLVFSHCHNCVRFSSFAIAERLASHGFVVAAPDHAGNTLFDDLAGTGVELDAAFLPVRQGDISAVIDALLRGDASIDIDPAQIGVFGHSFGGVTAGLVLQVDERPVAGLALASPMENPLLEGVEIDDLVDPLGFLLAVEDGSITEIGNLFIRRNFDEAQVPVWKGEVADAGHWSFSNIAGLHPQFAAGCGTGTRQTDNTPFTYLPVAEGLAIAQAYVTAFFAAHVLGDANAARYLGEDRFGAGVLLEQR